MKPVSFLRVCVYCAAIVLAHAILLGIVVRDGTVEKLMAQTFGLTELLIILGFIFARLATFILVPSVLVGFGVSSLIAAREGKPS